MATVLPTETPQFAFADVKELHDILINRKYEPGDVIVAGKNFGCGSSREQAVSTLRGYEIIIIAKSFSRIFFQNSINLGLKTIICPEIEAEIGDKLEFTENQIVNKTKGKEFAIIPYHKSQQAIIETGGLIPYTRKLLFEQSSKIVAFK